MSARRETSERRPTSGRGECLYFLYSALCVGLGNERNCSFLVSTNERSNEPEWPTFRTRRSSANFSEPDWRKFPDTLVLSGAPLCPSLIADTCGYDNSRTTLFSSSSKGVFLSVSVEMGVDWSRDRVSRGNGQFHFFYDSRTILSFRFLFLWFFSSWTLSRRLLFSPCCRNADTIQTFSSLLLSFYWNSHCLWTEWCSLSNTNHTSVPLTNSTGWKSRINFQTRVMRCSLEKFASFLGTL